MSNSRLAEILNGYSSPRLAPSAAAAAVACVNIGVGDLAYSPYYVDAIVRVGGVEGVGGNVDAVVRNGNNVGCWRRAGWPAWTGNTSATLTTTSMVSLLMSE